MGSSMLFCASMGSTTMGRSMLFYASVGSTRMGSRIIIFCASMDSTTMDRRLYFVIPQWYNVCATMGTRGVQIRSDRIRSDFEQKYTFRIVQLETLTTLG